MLEAYWSSPENYMLEGASVTRSGVEEETLDQVTIWEVTLLSRWLPYDHHTISSGGDHNYDDQESGS